MSQVHVQTQIRAPIERVWDTIMDPHRLGEWVTIHRDVSKVSKDPLEVGATMDQSIHMRGVTFKVRWTLATVTPPRTALWEGKGPAHSSARIRYELSEDGDGNTIFDYTNDFKPPAGRLGALASRVVIGAASEREARNTLQRLKELLERSNT